MKDVDGCFVYKPSSLLLPPRGRDQIPRTWTVDLGGCRKRVPPRVFSGRCFNRHAIAANLLGSDVTGLYLGEIRTKCVVGLHP